MPNLSDFLNNIDKSRQVFTTSDTWSVPSGVEMVDVVVVGGGGGGAVEDNRFSPEGPGGGGAGVITVVRDYYLNGETEITVEIGSGGNGGVLGATETGSDGGDSYFGKIVDNGWEIKSAGGGGGEKFYGGSSGHIIDPVKFQFNGNLHSWWNGYDGDSLGMNSVQYCKFQGYFPWRQPNVKIGGYFYSQYFAVGGRGHSGELADPDVSGSVWDRHFNANQGAINIGSPQYNVLITEWEGSGAGGFFGDGGSSSGGSPDAPTANTGAGGGGYVSVAGGAGSDGIVIVFWQPQ